MEKRGFTEKEAAIYLGVSRSFLRQDRMNGYRENRTPGPNFAKIGRNVRYLKEDLDSWLEKYHTRRKWPIEYQCEQNSPDEQGKNKVRGEEPPVAAASTRGVKSFDEEVGAKAPGSKAGRPETEGKASRDQRDNEESDVPLSTESRDAIFSPSPSNS